MSTTRTRHTISVPKETLKKAKMLAVRADLTAGEYITRLIDREIGEATKAVAEKKVG